MKDPNRIYKICIEIANLWACRHTYRFLQMMDNFFCWLRDHNMDPYYIEDDKVIDLFKQFIKSYPMFNMEDPDETC